MTVMKSERRLELRAGAAIHALDGAWQGRGHVVRPVETGSAAFVGPTVKGPIGGRPLLVTSFGAFNRIFGGLEDLDFGHGEVTNYLAHSVFNFFANGGERLFVSRVYQPSASRGYAHSGLLGGDEDNHRNIVFRATTPGRFGNRLRVGVTLCQSGVVRNAAPGSLMYADGRFYLRRRQGWVDHRGQPYEGGAARKTLVTVTITLRTSSGEEILYENLGFAPDHPRYIGEVLRPAPLDDTGIPSEELALVVGSRVSPFRLYAILRRLHGTTFKLGGGRDGAEPGASAYAQPLRALAQEEEIALVAAPGHSSFSDWEAIQQRLIAHVEAAGHYRFAILDPRPGQAPRQVLAQRRKLDCPSAALYYPWLVAPHPQAQRFNRHIPKEVVLPPSGFICGLYARHDRNRGVHAPLLPSLVRGATAFEQPLSAVHQQRLQELGINVPLVGTGVVAADGEPARTTCQKQEWTGVSERRYYLYLKHSIEQATRWAAEQRSDEALWDALVEQVGGFLHGEWRAGRLAGQSADEAYFVCCDHSTMELEDIEKGRVVLMIGFAPRRPIDFTIFWTTIEARPATSG